MIPVIDLQQLYSNPHHNLLVSRLDDALVQTGFCYLSQHGISGTVIDAAQSVAWRFFNRDPAYKLRWQIADAPRHSGYVPFTERGLYQDEAARCYEAYDIGTELPATDADFLAGNIFYGPNTWPDLDGFRLAISNYFSAVRRLADALVPAIECALALPAGSISQLMDKPTSQMRLIHYPAQLPTQAATASVNMGAHTDYEFFTLLFQTQPGLQTMDVRGEWIDAPPIPGTLVMNLGDLAEVISGGRYRSNPHRVLNGSTARLSIPYFAAFNYHAIVQPLVATARNHYPALHAGQHLLENVTRDFSYLRARRAGATQDNLTGASNINPFLGEKIPCPTSKP